MRRFFGFFTLALLAWTSVPAVPAWGQAVLWEIGKFDQSSGEFNDNLDFRNPSVNPVFRVGKSTVKDWPAAQPGSMSKWGGGRAHPYTILFDLLSTPKGVYRLTISTLLEDARYPALLVEINGKAGLFYLDRKLSHYPGDGSAYSPVYGADQLEVTLPTSALRRGENRLVLTALDDPKDGEGDTALRYDALRLSQKPGGKTPPAPQAGAEPTVFYTTKDNKLAEITNVIVTLPEKVRKGKVALEVGKENFEATLSAEHDFGQQRFEFAVPELSGETPAVVSLNLNGPTHRWNVMLEPKRKWTIYLVPHAHLDVGYTDYQAKVYEVQSRNLDALEEEIRQDPDMRFSLDGSGIVEHYLSTRKPGARNTFLRLAREGKIAVPAQAANLLTGYATLEELIRSTDYAYSLHHRFGIPMDYANITDVPSYTWSYASILSALGLKYFAAASNNDRGPILYFGKWDEQSPFWWQGPDGNKVLMAYTRQYSQLWFTCGLPPQSATCRQGVPTFLQAFESPGYKPDTVLMFGSQFENTDLVPGEPEFVKKWNSDYAYPKFVLATFPDYFRYIEKNYGAALETVSGDGGPYWDDAPGTDAWYAALDRADQQRAPSAEEISTLATVLSPQLAPPRELIARTWDDLVLYAEHTWSSWGSYSRPESEETVRQFDVKHQRVMDARVAVNALADQSLSQLVDQIHLPARALVVFNPLNWTRSELVEADLDRGMALAEYPDMKLVPVEVMSHGPGYDHVRFLANGVPSFGYKCYRIGPATGQAEAAGEGAAAAGSSIENSFYRIEVDPATGAVRSLFDKEINRELVDPASPYKLDQYLYVSGGDERDTQIVHMRKSLPLASLTISPAANGRVAGVRRTPYGQVLTVEASGLHAPSIQTDIVLFDGEKKVEFVNHLKKEPVNNKEAVYFAFPVAMRKPAFTYDIQNGWVDPSRDMLKGAGLEWFSVQHWVKVSDGEAAVALVPIDAPLVTLGDINRGTWPEEFQPPSATVFSYAINNYWHTNTGRVQSGDFTFRYALTSGRELAPETLARFGRAAMTPFEVDELTDQDKFDNPDRPLSPAPSSFLEIDVPNVVLVNWKAANDGRGSIVRLLETAGRSATAHLNFPSFSLQRAWRTNAAEEGQEALRVSGSSVEVPLKPHEIVTVRVVVTKMSRESAVGSSE